MSLFSELDKLHLDQLIDLFNTPHHSEGVIYYQEVAARIRQQGDLGIGFLFGRMYKASTQQLRGILLGLTFPPLEDPMLRTMLKNNLLNYLHHKQSLIVMEAIDGLRVQGEKDSINTVLSLRNHPSPYVRGGVLRYVSDLYPENALPLLIGALQDPHHTVRETAIDELDSLGVSDSISQIRPLLNDPHPYVRQAAQTAINNMENSPDDLTGD